ncbi:MAG: hypothetical protein IJT88_07280, partial [Kiritimatiellae bacterium]|nr:hypothetical protein [Kiritimatiellia bacterium]
IWNHRQHSIPSASSKQVSIEWKHVWAIFQTMETCFGYFSIEWKRVLEQFQKLCGQTLGPTAGRAVLEVRLPAALSDLIEWRDRMSHPPFLRPHYF